MRRINFERSLLYKCAYRVIVSGEVNLFIKSFTRQEKMKRKDERIP